MESLGTFKTTEPSIVPRGFCLFAKAALEMWGVRAPGQFYYYTGTSNTTPLCIPSQADRLLITMPSWAGLLFFLHALHTRLRVRTHVTMHCGGNSIAETQGTGAHGGPGCMQFQRAARRWGCWFDGGGPSTRRFSGASRALKSGIYLRPPQGFLCLPPHAAADARRESIMHN